MITRTYRRLVLSLAVIACASFVTVAVTARDQVAQSAQPTPSGMGDMMKMHEKMMAEMKAADARLDALVKTMNAAVDDAETKAIAAVVNELVAQHKRMHTHMNEMHQQMMGGRGMMMKH